jgi:hypothetical protein
LFQLYQGKGTKRGPQVVAFQGDQPQITGLKNGYFVLIVAFGDDLVGQVYSNKIELRDDNVAINTVSPVQAQIMRATPDGFMVAYLGQSESNQWLAKCLWAIL